MSVYPESATEAWNQRFGVAPPAEADSVVQFLRHRSVRSFSDQPVTEELVASLIGAAQSAATSSTLQMWSVVSVQDPDRRAKIAHYCADQDHVKDAPWYFAFLADHHRLRAAAQAVGEPAAGLGYLEYMIMAIIDASLAAERFVCAAESLGLGICYIGGLRNRPQDVKELLGLPDGVFGVFGLCLGYPKKPLEAHIKPRLDPDTVWFRETYSPQLDLGSFEERMKAFYESENMRGDFTWSKRSGRRVDRTHLTGRDVLKSWLAQQGIDIE